MMRLRSYIPLLAVSFFAASLSGGQTQKKSLGSNAPEVYPGGLSPEQVPIPSDGALQAADGAFSPISQPTADYVARTTLFLITQPDLSLVSSLTDAASGCTVTFSPALQARTVGVTWQTWGSPPDTEGAFPRILYSNGATSISMTYSGCGPTTLGFEAEPNPFQVLSMTATFYNGAVAQGSITRDVDGRAGARLFAADGSFDRVVFSSAFDFAIAQLRFAQGVQALLQGQVTDDTTGDGIQGAQVQAVGGVTRSALTDAMGNYRLFLPEDTYDVTASAFGYMPQTVAGITVSAEAPTTQNFALTSASRHRVSGTVTTADATPVAGAEVRILSTPIPPTRTDAKGNYAFANVPDGTYDIRAGGGGCLGTQTQSVTFTDDVVLNFVVPLRSDVFGYTCTEGIPFDWIPGDTLSALVGDDSIQTDPLPFTFNYYGVNYNNITYSTDIYANFGVPEESFVSQCIPSAGAVHGIVAVAWDDGFIPPGRIWTRVMGDPGSRLYVIEWRDVGYFASPPTDIITAEIILQEGSNNITFQYMRTDGRGAGGNSTVGIQNTTGTDGLQYSCHVATLSVGKRIDFIHP